jgi:hypothetical protein
MAILQWPQAAIGELIKRKVFHMSQPDLQNELKTDAVEPLLPIEKKLIGWSLGTGIVLLVILVIFNHLIPVKL